MNSNFNLPPGCSPNDPDFQADDSSDCAICGRPFYPTDDCPDICPRCRQQEDFSDVDHDG